MKSYTYEEILFILEERGYIVETTIERMMIIEEEMTGVAPDWLDTAPEWIVKKCLGV